MVHMICEVAGSYRYFIIFPNLVSSQLFMSLTASASMLRAIPLINIEFDKEISVKAFSVFIEVALPLSINENNSISALKLQAQLFVIKD